jgi:hypothetical protein
MDRSVAELAIKVLETERQKLDSAIRELRALVTDAPPVAKPDRRKRISRAGLKRISEASKRRWAKAHEAQAAVAAPATSQHKETTQKRSAQKKGGITPEGRARLAEATRQRNIARSAAAKKAAGKAS